MTRTQIVMLIGNMIDNCSTLASSWRAVTEPSSLKPWQIQALVMRSNNCPSGHQVTSFTALFHALAREDSSLTHSYIKAFHDFCFPILQGFCFQNEIKSKTWQNKLYPV